MTWSDFYLICFALGFILSLLSFLGSAHLHLPHIDFHIGGHAHAPHAGGGAGEITLINFGTVSAFLAWFGGAGYLLTRFYSFWFLIAFGLACLSGLVGAALIFFPVYDGRADSQRDGRRDVALERYFAGLRPRGRLRHGRPNVSLRSDRTRRIGSGCGRARCITVRHSQSL